MIMDINLCIGTQAEAFPIIKSNTPNMVDKIKPGFFKSKVSRLRNVLKQETCLGLPFNETFITKSMKHKPSPINNTIRPNTNSKSNCQLSHGQLMEKHNYKMSFIGKPVKNNLRTSNTGGEKYNPILKGIELNMNAEKIYIGKGNKSQCVKRDNKENVMKSRRVLHNKSMQMFEKIPTEQKILPVKGETKILQRAKVESKEYQTTVILHEERWRRKHNKLMTEHTKLFLEYRNLLKNYKMLEQINDQQYKRITELEENAKLKCPEEISMKNLPIITVDVKKKS